ncbi:hypothetical protein CHLNCDRAFT_132901 [Chlorella variabilis]|uniref:SAM-dependent MTase RsmB/NOP-type domain-containing protein n=1 Tax=Chlorella variabilis TaxID=554065 RepID=E1Z1W9_CHLVA|nr:hypothetical protein CHLNCDRAFT_132901 [Chlorella variabilis]EFN59890.1 hypothetical protein CHLNCDRAFT_132901 [Chlorella variabilis]|eukprot:XP_005851992.1 hypothetical protein CHLNCDRAFT_132901 [Chlorella variabilis]
MAARTYAPEISWDSEVRQYLEAALGPQKLAEISAALARPPLATCLRVNTLRTSPQDLLRRLPEALAPEDRALLETNPAYVHPLLPDAVILPGTGPHAVDYSRTRGLEVVVGRKAGESVMRGAHVFAPGMLAVSPGIEKGDLVAVSVGLELPGSDRYAYTRGTVLGSEHEAKQVEALGGQAPDRSRLFIGIGRAELSRTEFFQGRGGIAVTMLERVFRTPGCGDILPGDFMLQNVCSLVAAHVLAPRPGARVLDMCAAPGGKTTALAQLMGDRGEVVAFDRSHAKAAEVRRLAGSFGLTCVKAYKMDATKAVLQPVPQPGPELVPQQQQEQQEKEHGEATGAAAGAAAVAAAVAAGAGGASPAEASSSGCGAGAQVGEVAAAVPSGGGESAVESRGRRGGRTQPPSAATLRRLERIAASRQARGLDPAPSPHLAEGKEAAAPGFPPASFDHVLCDAPCTALGLRPRLVHRQTLRELDQTAAYQRKLLRVAVALVRPGGALVFSTCSINPGENEANVRWLLDTFPGMRLVQQAPRLGQPGLTGNVVLPCGRTQQLLSEKEAALVQRFDPSAPLDTIGFFVAKFEKDA